MNATATALPTYVKAMSNTGTIHLALEGSAEASCASGKARPLVTPLTEDEMARPITCKRCEKLALKIDAERIAAAADTSDIDRMLDEATSVQDITAALTAGLAAVDADTAAAARAEIEEGHLDDAAALLAAASDTEAAEEAAERDAAEAAPAAAPKAKGKGKGKAAAKAAQGAAPQAAAPAPAAPSQRQRLNQEELVLGYLRAHRGTPATPHEISKAVTPVGMKKLGLRDCCARLARDGKITVAVEKPVAYSVA